MERDEVQEVQDSGRQALLLSHCGLTTIKGRMAPADGRDKPGNLYELKSATRRGVTTARDVGLHTIEGWRGKYWVIAIGRNLRLSGFRMDGLYIAHPGDLEPFFAKLEERLGADWDTCNAVLAAALAAGVSPDTVNDARRVCKRGITVNNPKIPLKLVEQNATKLDHEYASVARRQVRRFVRSRPLRVAKQR